MYPRDGDRCRIVTGMCFTTRHDYGLVEPTVEEDNGSFVFSATAMNRQQQEALYRQMDQLYDHHIDPLVKMLTEILGSIENEVVKQRIQRAIKESGGG